MGSNKQYGGKTNEKKIKHLRSNDTNHNIPPSIYPSSLTCTKWRHSWRSELTNIYNFFGIQIYIKFNLFSYNDHRSNQKHLWFRNEHKNSNKLRSKATVCKIIIKPILVSETTAWIEFGLKAKIPNLWHLKGGLVVYVKSRP